MSREDFLFNQMDLRGAIEGQVHQMVEVIDGMAAAQLPSGETADFCAAMADKYGIQPIVLDETKITTRQSETTITPQNDPYLRAPVQATKIEFFVPFTGEADLFKCQPSSFTTTTPQGRVERNELILEYTSRDQDAGPVRAAFDRDLAQVKQYLSDIEADLAGLPARLQSEAHTRAQARLARLRKDQDMLGSLGFPERQ